MKNEFRQGVLSWFQLKIFAFLSLTLMSFSLMADFEKTPDHSEKHMHSLMREGLINFEDLGQPHHMTYAVKDLDAVKEQFSAVTGWEFREVEEETRLVFLRDVGLRLVRFRRVFSKPGFPFLEFVEANPPIGPWEATEDNASGYHGYAVDNVILEGIRLTANGFKKIAQIKNDHAIFEAEAGIRVELVKRELVPATEEASTPQAPILLGRINQVGWLVNNENIDPLKQRYASVTGLVWPEDIVFPDVPFRFGEASGAAIPGIYPTLVTLARTVQQGPEFVFQSGEIDLDPCDCQPPRDPCTFIPFDTSATHSRFKPPAWAVPGTDINGIIAQWKDAGLELVFDLDIGIGTPPLSYYKGIGGILYSLDQSDL